MGIFPTFIISKEKKKFSKDFVIRLICTISRSYTTKSPENHEKTPKSYSSEKLSQVHKSCTYHPIMFSICPLHPVDSIFPTFIKIKKKKSSPKILSFDSYSPYPSHIPPNHLKIMK